MSGHHALPAQNAESASKLRAALFSIGASVALTLAKAAAALLSGSLALLSEALHGLIDVIATVTTYLAIRAADAPADEEHHYGHGKVEALAALAETGLLFGLAGGVAWEAIGRLRGENAGHLVEVTPLVLGMIGFAILVDVTRWRALNKIARETRSEALAADALHFSADAVSSIMALGGLVAVKSGFAQGDSIAALGVASFISIAAFRLARRTIDTLIDAAPAGMTEKVRHIVTQSPGVADVEWVRVRSSGGRVLGEVGVLVSRTLPLDEVAEMKLDLQKRIRDVIPEIDLTLTANPIVLDDETAMERVMIVAARQKTPVHHILITQLDERLSVSLDMEVDYGLSIDKAHALATQLEAGIRAEFGAGTEVETHIEPLEIGAPAGRSATWQTVEQIGRTLADEAERGGIVSNVHSVRVRETDKGLMVNYHAEVDGAMDVASAHEAVDAVERATRLKHAGICRIVTHTEPRKAPPA